MTSAGALCLADTNILLRLVKSDHSEYPLVREAIEKLNMRDISVAYTHQNMAEFWNASTRPLSRNGFGLSVEETEENVRQLECSFVFLADGDAVYREWRRIVAHYRVSGVQVHDAHLVAAMYVHGLTQILTFNTGDFARFDHLIVTHPSEVRA